MADIQRLVRNEVRQLLRSTPTQPRRPYEARLADIPESSPTEDPVDTFVSEPYQVPTSYEYPRANNQSKNKPPRPCRHCGSPLHYDRDCESWLKANKRTPLKAKVGDSYHDSYVAMLEGETDQYVEHVATFLATNTVPSTNHTEQP